MNLGGRDYAAPKTNFVLSGGQVNKRDQKYNDKQSNNDYRNDFGFGGSKTQNYNNNDKW